MSPRLTPFEASMVAAAVLGLVLLGVALVHYAQVLVRCCG